MTEKQPFEQGFKPLPQSQDFPGLEKNLDPEPHHEQVPTEDGGLQAYKAAGKLEGKKAVITGGDSGIGRATAILFAMEGADSLIAFLPEEEEDARETKRRVEEKGRKCYLMATDLKKKENCRKVIDSAIDQMGAVDILFNNAAFQMMVDDIKDLSEEQWEHTFATNIHPYFYLSKYIMPHMEKKKDGVIINNASINAYLGKPTLLDYSSTKGAIVAFTRALSQQCLDKGIRVNAIAPGPVWTPLIPSTMTKKAIEGFSGNIGRPSQPSEIATCVVFLANSDSSSISGQTLHPNGGCVVNG